MMANREERPAQSCPDDAQIAAFAADALAAAESASVEAHCVACDACRRQLAGFIRFVAAAEVDPSMEGIDDAELAALDAETRRRARRLVEQALERRDRLRAASSGEPGI